MPGKTSQRIAGFILAAAVVALPIRATSLDSLIASNGTMSAGNLVFSNFSAGPATAAAGIDVNGFGSIASGMSPFASFGLRFSPLPAGRFSQTTAGGGGRELVVDVSFTVTVNDASAALHSVSQSIDPTSAANGNAILRSLTGIPAGAPSLTLFSCIQGSGVPGGTTCPSPSDTSVLAADVVSLNVDRQIQIVVGQRGGQSADGDASSGFFDVSFGEAQSGCPAIAVTPTTIPDGNRLSLFPAVTFASTGGASPVTFALSGSLPAGLLFDPATATLAGTPVDHGLFTVTVIATDAHDCHGSQTYSFLIRDPRRRSARH
jgi:hypothetical protein